MFLDKRKQMSSLRWLPVLALLSLATELSASPTVAVLEYHQPGGDPKRTREAADLVREELGRRRPGVALTREQTVDIFSYYRESFESVRSPKIYSAFREGKRAYYELQFPEAEGAFRRVIRDAEEAPLVESHLLLGQTLLALDRPGEARDHLREAYRLDPTRRLDPRLFPPRTIGLWKKVEREALPDSVLEVTSDPPGADLLVNGTFRGITPMRLTRFPAGRHLLRFRASGHGTEVQEVNLVADQVKSVFVKLPWQGRGAESVVGFGMRLDPTDVISVAAQAGGYLKVEKVLLVSVVKEKSVRFLEVRLVDSELEGSLPVRRYEGDLVDDRGTLINRVAQDVLEELKVDLLQTAGLAGRYEGDILLLAPPQKPLYRRPLFWVLVGAGAGTGGALAAVLGGAGAATGVIGIVFQ